MSHIINIEGCSAGSYTKVRKQLNQSLGGPEFWEYDKPMFTVDCSGDSFDALETKLSSIDGIEFLPDHEVVEVVAQAASEPEVEEAAEVTEVAAVEEVAAVAEASLAAQLVLEKFLSKYPRKG